MSLINAVKNRNVNAIRKLLNNGANVNQADNENGITPLIKASSNGNLELVKLLLAKGADVNKANKKGETPPYFASKNGHANVVQLLIEKGADVNKATKGGFTPLMGASQGGYTVTVSLLLAAPGIDVNKANKDGTTALYWATYYGRTITVKVLLKAGAKVNKADKDGVAPLSVASYEGHMDIVKLLLAKRANINQVDNDGESALYAASDAGNYDIVELLMAKGADVNKADNEGRTNLWIATRNGHVSTVRELLKSNNVQVDKADKKGWTPLMIASQFGSPLCARALLKAGANVNKTKPDGVTALHIAAFNDQEDVVKELLAAKDIDLFKKNRDGRTALDDAKSEAVKKLLRKAMGFTLRWKNMNNDQRRGMKPILLKRMIAKGLKNGKNATFTEPILYENYKYINLKPVNSKGKKINSFGLVIDDKNNVQKILNLEGARLAMRMVRERANRANKTVEQPLPGIIYKNWELINFTPNEYFNAMKDLMKISAIAKSARTRKNLKSSRMNRIEANQRKTARIATLRSTIQKSKKELNNLM